MLDTPLRPDQRTDQGNTSPPSRRRRRWLWLGGLVVLAAGVVGLTRTEPAAVGRQRAFLAQADPQVLRAMADQVEQRLLALASVPLEGGPAAGPFSRAPGDAVPQGRGLLGGPAAAHASLARSAAPAPDGDQPPVLFLTTEEINAWLRHHLEEWMAYRGYAMPAEVRDPLLAIEDGQLMLSFELDLEAFRQRCNAGFELEFLPGGEAVLRVHEVRAGLVPLPVSGIGRYLASRSSDQIRARQVGQWLERLEEHVFKPVVKIERTRKRVLLRDCQVLEQGVELTLEVEDRSGLYSRPRPAFVVVEGK